MALTAAQIVTASLTILDEYGLADLSMRRIAGILNVQAGALYHHMPNKQTLLAGMADQILSTIPEPLGPWRNSVAEWAHGLRAGLLTHRDAADLVATARGFQLMKVDATRHPTTLLSTTGLPLSDARNGATTLLHFVIGHVAEEQAHRDRQQYLAADLKPAGTELSFSTGVELIVGGIAARISDTANP